MEHLFLGLVSMLGRGLNLSCSDFVHQLRILIPCGTPYHDRVPQAFI